MNLSYNWLKELVPFTQSPEEIAKLLTSVGCCVEGLEQVGDDWRLVAEVTTNRPDWLCHWGVAREIAAITGIPARIPAIDAPAKGKLPVEKITSVTNEAIAHCPRYTARVITGLKVGPSPAWLVKRLEAVGLGSRNNVVDITNLILFEMNQPLHAFDLDQLAGKRIIVRYAKEGEPFTSVFGEERKLTKEMCVIADEAHANALAGVKGGLGSAISDSTTNILLESAYFNQATTRRSRRAANLESDSSYRYERGIDPGMAERASLRACQLILELAGGELAPGVIDTNPNLAAPWEVKLRFSRCTALLGLEVQADKIISILTGLGLELISKDAAAAIFRVPTFRGDLTREADLIEEVARCHGYQHIPTTVGMRLAVGHVQAPVAAKRTATEVLVGLGYNECVNDSLVARDRLALVQPIPAGGEPLVVKNPIREDRPCLRQSLLPSLLEARCVNRLEKEARLFEISRVFYPKDGSGISREPRRLAIVDDRAPEYVRGALEAILAEMRISGKVSVEPLAQAPLGLAPGTCAKLLVDGKEVAVYGKLTKAAADRFDLITVPAVLEADMDAVSELPRLDKCFTLLPKFPAIDRDIALVVPEEVQWAKIESLARQKPEFVEGIAFASCFRGKQIPQGTKSMAFTIVYRAPDRSLTDEEANKLRDGLVAHLTAAIPGACLRA